MSGTPMPLLMSTQNGAGDNEMAAYAARNAYAMSPTATHEMRRTPRTPKYSLMTSVMMKTNGHTSTPAVKFSVPEIPKMDQLNGGAPSVASRAKIFTPTNSPISAFVRKNPAKKMNSEGARASVVRTGSLV